MRTVVFLFVFLFILITTLNAHIGEDGMYQYNARILRVIDGDTIKLEIDLGFTIKMVEVVRLARVDTYEKRGEEKEKGLKAKKFVQDQFPALTRIIVTTTKKGKFGRYIAEVVRQVDGKNLSDMLIEAGHVKNLLDSSGSVIKKEGEN